MTYSEFWRSLTAVYDAGEAQAVARLVLEQRFGLSLADVLSGQMPDAAELRPLWERLLAGEPVQYVLGEAEFGGRKFLVTPDVLIPRPETYELCQWVLGDGCSVMGDGCHILDIGTGSGCIACTLAAELPKAEATGWDISEAALRIAAENAKRTHVHVSFEQVDILHPSPTTHHSSPITHIISNPPYICRREAADMAQHVLEHEPHQALFVPDDDPLLFYRAIGQIALRLLVPAGRLYFEINPLYAEPLRQLLCDQGFTAVSIREDQFGKQRFIKAVRQ